MRNYNAKVPDIFVYNCLKKTYIPGTHRQTTDKLLNVDYLSRTHIITVQTKTEMNSKRATLRVPPLSNLKVGQSAGNFFVVPLHFFGSTCTISRFGERFRDGQFS